MNDMSQVIIPKSDQINSDDLIAGPMTITVAEVQIKGGQEQPVSIFFDGSEKAFRPCKSMSRVLVQAWGADASKYVGRSMTLYRDPEVKWGGLAVGGIRISHLSDIDGVKQMMLTATKGSRKPFKVLPLVRQAAAKATDDGATKWANAYISKIASVADFDELLEFERTKDKKLAELQTARPELFAKVTNALIAAKTALTPASTFDDDEPFDAPAAGSSLADQIADGVTAPTAEQDDPETGEITDVHPGTAVADKLIAEIEAPECNAIMDVGRVMLAHENAISAMLDEDSYRVNKAADDKRAAIRAAQAKAKKEPAQ